MSTDDTGASDMEWPLARDEARAVLRDALEWNMTATRWDQVRGVVEEMASAAANASPAALWRMTGSLELFSPVRVIVRMGDSPSALPAPKLVRDRIVELIDALAPAGESQPAAGSADSVVGSARPARHDVSLRGRLAGSVTSRLTAPGLLAHVFLADGGRDTRAARENQRSGWNDLIRRLGLGQAISGLQAPLRLAPGPALPSGGFVLLAAAERAEPAVWQASAWLADGLAGFTVMMAPERHQDCARTWRDLEHAWADAVAGLAPEFLLGESRTFLALTGTGPTATGPALTEEVRVAAPEPARPGWWQNWDSVPLGSPGEAAEILLWEIGTDTSDARILRRIIAVAPVASERQADWFAWTAGGAAPSPLTRHLTHAARLRYQVRVFDEGKYPRQLRDQLGTLTDDLLGETGSGRARAGDPLSPAHGTAIALRRRLDAMRYAIGGVEENLRLALDLPESAAMSGPLSEDRHLATWFGRRLNDELTLLDAAIENAQSARDFLHQSGTELARWHVLDHAVSSLPAGLVSPQPQQAQPQRRAAPAAPWVVIFTALGLEYTAIRDYLGGGVERYLEHDTLYEVGALPGVSGSWRVALAETGPGSTMAALQLDRAVRVFAPEIALYLGVAGGRKDVALGDVVVADTIYDYESGKSTLNGFQPRLRTHYPAYRLLQWARMVARQGQWPQRIRPSGPAVPPAAFVKPIVTGGKVITHDQADAALLIDRYAGDALAVETEGHGFLTAAYLNTDVDALVIRGISDLLTGKDQANDEQWQPVASRNAAAFAVELLDSIGAGMSATD